MPVVSRYFVKPFIGVWEASVKHVCEIKKLLVPLKCIAEIQQKKFCQKFHFRSPVMLMGIFSKKIVIKTI